LSSSGAYSARNAMFRCLILFHVRYSNSASSNGPYSVRSNGRALVVDSHGDVTQATDVAPLMRMERIDPQHDPLTEPHPNALIEKDSQNVFDNLTESFAPKILQELSEETDVESLEALGENVKEDRLRGNATALKDPPGSGIWTNWFSEENGGMEPYLGLAIDCWRCKGASCDDNRVRHVAGRSTSTGGEYWTDWFSEEKNNPQECRAGYVVARAHCKGSNCDDLRLLCQKPGPTWLTLENVKGQSGTFSEESPGWGCCPSGQYVYGMQCSGDYCDNHKLFCKGWKKAPQNGEWKSWGSWGSCTQTCGSGSQKRSRTSSAGKDGGKNPAGAKEQQQACNTKACPAKRTTTTTTTTTVVLLNKTKSSAHTVHTVGARAVVYSGFLLARWITTL